MNPIDLYEEDRNEILEKVNSLDHDGIKLQLELAEATGRVRAGDPMMVDTDPLGGTPLENCDVDQWVDSFVPPSLHENVGPKLIAEALNTYPLFGDDVKRGTIYEYEPTGTRLMYDGEEWVRPGVYYAQVNNALEASMNTGHVPQRIQPAPKSLTKSKATRKANKLKRKQKHKK